MKVRYGTLLLISLTMMVIQWSCKNNNIVGVNNSVPAAITGTVLSSSTPTPISGATVILSYGNTQDSVVTGSDGTFEFAIDIADTTNGTNVVLTVHASGFLTATVNSNVKGNIYFPILLNIDPSIYAIVTGMVQDSATTYDLRGASVLIALPGVVDSTTTLQNGSFTVDVNLENVNSIAATITVTQAGFKTYRTTVTLKKGADNVGTILLPIDQSSAYAHIVGHVTDSRSGEALTNVSVLLSSTIATDSTKTLSDGSYSFDLNLQGPSSVSGTLSFQLSGFRDTTINISANAGQTATRDVALTTTSNYAIITGTVRDSASGYPLAGTSVIISLPANVSSTSKFISFAKTKKHSVSSIIHSVSSLIIDSTTTLVDGSFSMAVDLVDLNSISAMMTVSKTGFVTSQTVQTFQAGTNNLGNILLDINNSASIAQLVGYVTDSHSALPITGVSVYLTTAIKVDSTKTLNDGSYSFNLNLQGLSSVSGTLLFRLNSYDDTTISFSANAGQTLTENVALNAKSTVVGGDSSTGRGIARSIELVSVSTQEISIHGVGANETSVVVWQVLDSLGFPLDINHSDTVTFVPTGIPVTSGNPAYVTPTFGVTNGSGEASTTINSGTVAGTIQLVATLRLRSGTIVESSPVLITVDGGLPDQAHFELNSNLPHAANFAGYDWSEVPQGFTVQAGDKYANPVHPGTAIYFSTTGGIITAAGQTDAGGHANATLYSGNPLPKTSGLDPAYFGDGTGYAYVKAFTEGENGVTVADSDLICISASVGPILFDDSISIAPVILSDGIGSVTIPVHISDRFGNPLEAGTTISSSVSVTPPPPNSGITWSVSTAGLPSDNGGQALGDYLTRGSGSTEFTLIVSGSAYPAAILATSPLAFTVTVTVKGRNTDNESVSNSFSGQLVP